MLKEIWFNRGNELFREGKHVDAATYYDKTIELDPKNANSWEAKARP